jgi:hypothetical protein
VCTCDIGVKGEKYASKMCSYHCNGTWLMCFHGSLLIFLFYLKNDENIRIVIHTSRIIYKILLHSYISFAFLL